MPCDQWDHGHNDHTGMHLETAAGAALPTNHDPFPHLSSSSPLEFVEILTTIFHSLVRTLFALQLSF